jgi:monooxygenase
MGVTNATTHFDVLIVGAGISGLGAAVYLQKECPGKSYTILERRPNIGGTWDLFRYPGVRSDSDMYTLGYRFKPWTSRKAIADGPAILNYLQETVGEYNLKDKIQHGYHVKSASWSSVDALWTVKGVRDDGLDFTITCQFYFNCTGYYDYDQGFTPDYPGQSDYKGMFVHPQHWPKSLDYKGKKVVVIGSGATAVTVVPAMCDQGAGHVTMLQRTPTWMISRPSEDRFARILQATLPSMLAYKITRYRNVMWQQWGFNLARSRPKMLGKMLLKTVRKELKPGYDVDKHFVPPYNPWEQRVCLVPDSDLFRVLNTGQAEIVTDHIDRLTETGILLKSGQTLDADIIVSATGLNLQMLSGTKITVDGRPFNPGESVLYKGIMFNDVPNMAMWFGYTNASWTLKADLTSEYMCRVINHMDATGTKIATPKISDPNFELENFVDFTSSYFKRSWDKLPKSGTKLPWKLHQNYTQDIKLLRKGPITDDIQFSKPVQKQIDDPAMLEAAE